MYDICFDLVFIKIKQQTNKLHTNFIIIDIQNTKYYNYFAYFFHENFIHL